MKFSEKLQTLRKERKMSQEQLADELDVSRQSVSKWESGTTYPEMDKLLGICKIFNCTLDELTNDNIKEINIASNEKSANPVNVILEYFETTIDVIANMSFKEIIKCCITMFIVALFILMLRVPFEFLINSLEEVYLNLGTRFGNFLLSFTTLIINLINFVLGAVIFFYVFKIKYIDNYKESNISKDTKETKEKTEVKTDESKEETNVTIIKNNKNSFLDVLVNIIIYFIKGILFICALPFVFTLIGLSVAFIISILIIIKNIISIGLIITLLSLMLLNIFGLQMIYYFIFNRKINIKGTFVIFISSIILLGVGGGIFTYELTKYTYVDELPKYATLKTEIFDYKMEEDLCIDSFIYIYDYEYVSDEALKDEVKIEVSYYDNFNHIEMSNINNCINLEFIDINPSKIIKNIINDISTKKLYNYNEFGDVKIKIYSSSKNIEQLKNNYKEYIRDTGARERTYIIKQYEKEIENLEAEIERLKQFDAERNENMNEYE